MTQVPVDNPLRVEGDQPAEEGPHISPQRNTDFQEVFEEVTQHVQDADPEPSIAGETHPNVVVGLENGEGSQLAQIPVEVLVNALTSTSDKSLTLQEVLAMKEQNPVEALRRLQQFRHDSVVVEPVDLAVEISPEMEVKLHELKRFLFDREILAAIAEEDPVANEIFKILDELILNGLPDPIAKYLIEFEAFFTRLVRDLAVHRQGDLQILIA